MGKERLMQQLHAKLVKKHGHSNRGYLKVYESSFQANLNWHKNFKTQQSCKAYTAIRRKLCAHCLHWPFKLQAKRLELPQVQNLEESGKCCHHNYFMPRLYVLLMEKVLGIQDKFRMS